MALLIFISHPEVVVDPAITVTEWGLSDTGRKRAQQFANSGLLSNVTAFWTSRERKAQEAAEIIAAHRGMSVKTDEKLGENDRSATGYLPPPKFEAAADAFFAEPDVSFQGWETAIDAQIRIETAVRDIIASHTGGDLAILSHGAVGTLLYCALAGLKISREHDQPGQGHYWTADLRNLTPNHAWKRL